VREQVKCARKGVMGVTSAHFETAVDAPVTVVTAMGEIDVSNSDEFERVIVEAWKAQGLPVVVDLRRVEFMCSQGINAILLAAYQIRSLDGEMRLRSPSRPVARLFQLMDMARVIDIEK